MIALRGNTQHGYEADEGSERNHAPTKDRADDSTQQSQRQRQRHQQHQPPGLKIDIEHQQNRGHSDPRESKNPLP